MIERKTYKGFRLKFDALSVFLLCLLISTSHIMYCLVVSRHLSEMAGYNFLYKYFYVVVSRLKKFLRRIPLVGIKKKNKIRKTYSSQRGVYQYIFDVRNSEGEYVQEVVVIQPGEHGVTEVDIRMLHSLDDSEVHNNLKNLRPKRTAKEKEAIKEFKQAFISEFITQNGYEPHEKIVNEAVRDAFPRNYNLSLDFDNDGELDQDKGLIALETSTTDTVISEWSESMLEAMAHLTPRQHEIIELMFVKKLKQNEIALILDISPAAVNKHYKKAIETLKKNL